MIGRIFSRLVFGLTLFSFMSCSHPFVDRIYDDPYFVKQAYVNGTDHIIELRDIESRIIDTPYFPDNIYLAAYSQWQKTSEHYYNKFLSSLLSQ